MSKVIPAPSFTLKASRPFHEVANGRALARHATALQGLEAKFGPRHTKHTAEAKPASNNGMVNERTGHVDWDKQDRLHRNVDVANAQYDGQARGRTVAGAGRRKNAAKR